MDAIDSKGLADMLAKPMPNLASQQFVNNSVSPLNKQASIRFAVFITFDLIAVLSFMALGPIAEMLVAINQISQIRLISTEQVLPMFVPLLTVIGVGIMVKGELS